MKTYAPVSSANSLDMDDVQQDIRVMCFNSKKFKRVSNGNTILLPFIFEVKTKHVTPLPL